MKRFIWIFACLALASCVPLEAVQTDAATDSPVASQNEVETVTEENNHPQSAGGQVEIIGGDEQSLRKFIQRYFSPRYLGAGDGDTKILIGSLPDDLPIDLPLPEDAQVIAYIRQPYAFNQVILDVPQTPEDVLAFYTQSLADLGWRQAQANQPGGGFISVEVSSGRFCLGENDAYLEVRALEAPEGLTDVLLTLQVPVDAYLCQETGPEYMDAGSRLIPSLEAPQGVQISSSGSGGSSDGSAYNTADLQTSLSIDELLSHYNAQLEQAGWELVDQGTSEVVAWSAWKFLDDQGDEWGGNLIVMDNRLQSDRRVAIVSIERVD